MPRIERTSTVTWEGNLARGEGLLTAASGAFADLGFSLPSRIRQLEGKTSPEELLAAAHGGCITTGLANVLTTAGTPPGRLDVSCLIIMDEIPGQGHQIVGSKIEVVGAIDGIDEATFKAAVEEADDGCPFSILLRNAGADVSVSARLAQ
jgi:osmotically inducible protein OsmC